MSTSSIVHQWENIDFKSIFIILVTAWVSAGLVRIILRAFAQALPDRLRVYVLPWIPAFRLEILTSAIMLAAPHIIRPSTENALALIGTVGLALGFAVKDYVSSVVAGIIALFERDYRVGDWIELGGHYGEVKKIGFRAIHLATIDDNEIIVPHAQLLTSPVLNATSGNVGLQCTVGFFLHPDHDADRANAILLEVTSASELAASEPPIKISVSEIPGATRYIVRVYAKDSRDQYRLKTAVTLRAKAELRKAGIMSAVYPFSVSSNLK